MAKLSNKRLDEIIDKALREHYCVITELKVCPNEYVEKVREGGECKAVALAIAREQHKLDEENLR